CCRSPRRRSSPNSRWIYPPIGTRSPHVNHPNSSHYAPKWPGFSTATLRALRTTLRALRTTPRCKLRCPDRKNPTCTPCPNIGLVSLGGDVTDEVPVTEPKEPAWTVRLGAVGLGCILVQCHHHHLRLQRLRDRCG